MFGPSDAGHIVNVLPVEVDVSELRYTIVDGRLALTDDRGYSLDIDEFGAFG